MNNNPSQVRSFRASSLEAALRRVERELGPQAEVLATQPLSQSFWGRLWGRSQVEVIATAQPAAVAVAAEPPAAPVAPPATTRAPSGVPSYRQQMRDFALAEQGESLLESMVERHAHAEQSHSPACFQLYTEMLASDVEDRLAEAFLQELRHRVAAPVLEDVGQLRRQAMDWLQSEIAVTPPLEDQAVRRRVVALVGTTGVGKTTTVAKLAANLRLREKRRVGLITVDTYRIAAVDQLRAYADIIDLPMEVVTTPREMRDAVTRLADVDLLLIDTAGRSPKDDVQIQELKAMLCEARADEVHLVMSAVGHPGHFTRVIEQFRPVQPTALLLTKLDEVLAYGHLLPLFWQANLPLSYTTHGQNVPDDIQPARPQGLVESLFPQGIS